MPKGRLTEKHVQEVALNFLKSYYSEKYNLEKVYAEKEICVKREYGGGRADGIIAFKRDDGNFVASMEAKSLHTKNNFIPVYKDKRLIFHTIGLGLIAFIVTLILTYNSTNWFIKWILPIASFLFVVFIFLYFMIYSAPYFNISVVRQVQKYPGNEKWIAISTDSYNNLSEDEKIDLCTKLSLKKIGLLLVSSRKKISILEYPTEDNKRKLKRKGNYLQYYSKSSEILRFLDT